MPRFRRIETCEAAQYDPAGDPIDGVVGREHPGIWTESGFQAVRQGDWVLTMPDGRRKVYSDRYFRAYFERVCQ